MFNRLSHPSPGEMVRTSRSCPRSSPGRPDGYDTDASDGASDANAIDVLLEPLQSTPPADFDPRDYVVAHSPGVPWHPPAENPDLLRKPHAFQSFRELIADVGRTPGRHASLAQALAGRLERAGVALPPAGASPADTLMGLCGSRWRELLDAGRIDISAILGAVGRLDDVDPPLRMHECTRLRTAVETAVARLALEHGRLTALLDPPPVPPRRHAATSTDSELQSSPMLVAFKSGVLNLAYLPESGNASAGQLARCMQQCIGHLFLRPDETSALLPGQIEPAVGTLVSAGHIPPDAAPRFLEAARRLDSMLHLWACHDLPEPLRDGAAGTDTTPGSARRLHLFQLMSQALDPAGLNDALVRGDLASLLPYPPDHPAAPLADEPYLAMVRLALRPMVDSGLVSSNQRNALMQLLKRQMVAGAAGQGSAAEARPQVTGSGSTTR